MQRLAMAMPLATERRRPMSCRDGKKQGSRRRLGRRGPPRTSSCAPDRGSPVAPGRLRSWWLCCHRHESVRGPECWPANCWLYEAGALTLSHFEGDVLHQGRRCVRGQLECPGGLVDGVAAPDGPGGKVGLLGGEGVELYAALLGAGGLPRDVAPFGGVLPARIGERTGCLGDSGLGGTGDRRGPHAFSVATVSSSALMIPVGVEAVAVLCQRRSLTGVW